MKFVHGTEAEHKATVERTKRNNPGKSFSIWSGDIKRNAYLRENLQYMEERKIATNKLQDVGDQESEIVITWI